MKNVLIISLIYLTLVVTAFGKIEHSEAKKIAGNFLNSLVKNDADAMFAQFTETVQKQLPLDQTKLIWKQITDMFGEYKSMSDILTSDYNDFIICSSVMTFQKGMVEAKITINNDKLISGFFLTPKKSEEEYKIPAYADTTKFAELAIKFGEEPFILDGILTLPKSKTTTAVVVLVHGSGPHDMDETVGPNKPFKDIAWGLASNGIACIRFNKRTKQYGDKMMQVFEHSDVYDEVINDAVHAVNFVSNNAEIYNIDKNKIYVIGHSLGGTLLPRIAKKADNLAGVISLAGMSRKIENVLLEQYDYLFSLDGEISQEEQSKIDELKQQIRRMLSPDLNPTVPADSLPLSMPAKYWMTFKQIDPAKEIKELDMKVMILQGGRDYQVTTDDFKLWKDGLKNNSKTYFKVYDNLNHLFQPGEGKSKPDEYYRPAHVEGIVIKDISEWIKK